MGVMFCGSLFIFLFFLFRSFYCLFFFDLQLLIIPFGIFNPLVIRVLLGLHFVLFGLYIILRGLCLVLTAVFSHLMAQVLVQITRARSLMFSSLSQDGTLWVSLDCGVSGYNMERLIVDKGG